MAWTLFMIYVAVTTYLGYLGSRRTKDFSTFAVGDGHMSPWMVGITLAASTASAATFIINPGFVYVHGLAAFMHLGVAVFAGIFTMLCVASYRFRRIGQHMDAVTIPGWLGKRYDSSLFALYFSIVNLFSFAFLVLLVGGISIVMQELLDISNIVALLITLVFVTGYVIVGGTYAHVFTNVLQGSLMAAVAITVIISGIGLMTETPDFWAIVASNGDQLTAWVNPDSNLYSDIWSVYVSGFLIGIALVCQPHILTKALYVDSDRQVTRYLIIFGVVYLLFTALLLAGFWALITVPPEALLDAETGLFRQDLVMTSYLKYTFPDWAFTVISIVLLAAAMSTLDGLMVGLATITAHDFWGNITGSTDAKAYKVSHIVLIALAILTFFVTIQPPELLGIFGQFGVYALVLTSLPPLLNGIWLPSPSLPVVWIASVSALVIYLLLFIYGDTWFATSSLSFANPAVPASIAILCSIIPALLIDLYLNKQTPHA